MAWVSRSSGVTSARSSCSRTLWSRRSGDIAPDNASPSRSWPRSPRSATDGAVRHIAAIAHRGGGITAPRRAHVFPESTRPRVLPDPSRPAQSPLVGKPERIADGSYATGPNPAGLAGKSTIVRQTEWSGTWFRVWSRAGFDLVAQYGSVPGSGFGWRAGAADPASGPATGSGAFRARATVLVETRLRRRSPAATPRPGGGHGCRRPCHRSVARDPWGRACPGPGPHP